MADNEGLYYTTIEGFVKWVSANMAGVLANDNVNSFNVDTEQETLIKEALLHAEGKVDGFLKKRGYTIPIPDQYERSINVIKIYARNIATFELYGRRGITKEQYYKYQRNISTLKDIANGDEQLPDSVPFSGGDKIAHGNKFDSPFSIKRHSL